MKYISLEKSNKPNEKLVIKFSEPNRTIHFGSKHSLTYLDHHDKHKRSNYLTVKPNGTRKKKINAKNEDFFLRLSKILSCEFGFEDFAKPFQLQGI